MTARACFDRPAGDLTVPPRSLDCRRIHHQDYRVRNSKENSFSTMRISTKPPPARTSGIGTRSWIALASASIAILVSGMACNPRMRGESVVVYVSTDRPYSEPVLQAFEKKSGIAVKAVYDGEETLSSGLANRLLGEKVY